MIWINILKSNKEKSMWMNRKTVLQRSAWKVNIKLRRLMKWITTKIWNDPSPQVIKKSKRNCNYHMWLKLNH